MKNALLAPLLLLLLLTTTTTTNAQDHTPRIPPPSLFPAHTLVWVATNADNTAYDCAWAFNCGADMAPNTHTKTARSLGRVSGWMVHGAWDSPHGAQSYSLVGSVYRDWQAAREAMRDFNWEAQQPQPALSPFSCHLAASVPDSRITCFRFRDPDGITRYWAYAERQGPVEVELLVIASTRYTDARSYALRQLQYAITTGPP